MTSSGGDKWLKMLKQHNSYFGIQYPPDMLELDATGEHYSAVCTPQLKYKDIEYQLVWIVTTRENLLDMSWFDYMKKTRAPHEVVFMVDSGPSESITEANLYYYTLGPLGSNGTAEWRALIH
jgi:hypothetical protein